MTPAARPARVSARPERAARERMTSVMWPGRSRAILAGVNFPEAVELVPFLRALAPADLEALRPYARCRTVVRGQRLWGEGDPTEEFTFLAQGRAKLVKASEAGREVIVEMSAPGELLCSSAVCAFTPYCCSALAFEGDAVVVTVPRRDLLGLLERSSGASRAFLREVTGREARLARRVEELAGGQVERRVAMLLLRLAEQTGRPAEDGAGTLIPIQFSRQDLADLVGTTLETAIRVMTRFGREGVVDTLGRGLRVRDRCQLEQIARGVPLPRADRRQPSTD